MRTLKLICEKQIISNSGIIIVEHRKSTTLEETLFCLKKIDERNYGDTTISFYVKEQMQRR